MVVVLRGWLRGWSWCRRWVSAGSMAYCCVFVETLGLTALALTALWLFVVVCCERGFFDHNVYLKLCCVMCDVFCVFVLVRRWTITGTLDPVCSLTTLTALSLFSNSISGMRVRMAV
jgi:hypothetical protein